MRRWLWILVCLLGLGPLSAQDFDPEKDIGMAVAKGVLTLTVPEKVHLKTTFMKVALKPGQPGSLRTGLPPAAHGTDELNEGIWRGRVDVPLVAEGLRGEVVFDVTYQPCTEGEGGVCFPPTKRELKVDAKALSGGAGAAPTGSAPEGLWGLFLVAFLAGLAASVTPCVYPMIPVTMAVIGAKGGGKARGFALSATLVLGMAATYTALGVVAAKTGAAFGAFAQKPAFLVPVALLFGVFALSLFGAFEISLPASVQAKLQGDGSRKGFAGAFVMGLVLGPISAPCVGPVIGSVLLGISQQGQAILGGAQLFVFALGMGVLFLAVGTFSAGLPRSGDWLVRLKQAMGLVVLGFAVWTLRYILPAWASLGLWSVVAITASVVLGAFRPAESLPAGLAKGLGILALAAGVFLGLRGVEGFTGVDLLPRGGSAAKAEAPAWRKAWMEQDLEKALEKAKAEGKVVLVDIYAEWCAQCHELDEKTWPDPAISAWISANAVAIRIDTDKVRPDLATKLGIRSYPTVLVLDADGKELRRILGFQKAAEMLAWLG
jgi:thiol:disulfide interchange protein DsbD